MRQNAMSENNLSHMIHNSQLARVKPVERDAYLVGEGRRVEELAAAHEELRERGLGAHAVARDEAHGGDARVEHALALRQP